MKTKRKPTKAAPKPKPADKLPRPSADPDAVLIALLGWWDGINTEIGRVANLMNQYRKCADSNEFFEGFGFAKAAAYSLMNLQQELDDARPSPPVRTTAELFEEVRRLEAGKDGAA